MTESTRYFQRLACVVTLVLCGVTTPASAQDPAAATIITRLKAARPDLNYGVPTPSSMPGLYEVQVTDGPLLYVSADGKRFIAGDLFTVQEAGQGFTNIAEQKRQTERRDLIAAVSESDMIVFAPPNPRATLTVFTDVDCGYCRKLHQEVPELNRMGIAVHYLAFPRAGVGSESYRKLATAWCASDRQQTLTRLKNNERVPDDVCPQNPVAAQMLLGERVGVSGTPALVLEDGTMLPGYRPAKDIAHVLGID